MRNKWRILRIKLFVRIYENKSGEGTNYSSCWHCMEVSRQLHTSVVYNRKKKKHLGFRLYAYMRRKIPFLYRESKDDSSATMAVVHSTFHLSYRGSEETGKYKAYEIQRLLQNYCAVTFFGFIYFPQSFQITNLRSLYTYYFFSHQLMHFHIQLCISLLSYIKIT
jgi:hypothetical protein